jgi:predicted lipoprotein
MKLKNIGLIILATSFIWSCKSDDKPSSTDNFDISTILTNYADNIIIERYEKLSVKTADLKNAAVSFNANVSQANLDILQDKFRLAYLAWQENSAFQFGYAKTVSLRKTLNTFPTNTSEIKKLINDTTINQKGASYIDATGLPGLDYILFSDGDPEVLSRFTTAENKKGAKKYLLAITTSIAIFSDEAYSFWKNNEEGFKADFKTDKSKAVKSSFSNLVNEFVYDTEFMKNYQLSYPIGKYGGLNIPRPEIIEAKNSKYNIQLYKEHLFALKKLYLGEDQSGTNGIGFDDYLIALKSKRNGEPLNTLIIEQFNLIDENIDLISLDLLTAIENQAEILDKLFVANKLLVSYFKVDMCSEFGIQITYTDNDGD